MTHALVVDDDFVFLMLSSTIAKNAGYTVQTASCAEDALKMLQDGYRPSLIFTDNDMKKMSGLELIAAAITIDPKIACVIASGGHPSFIEKAKQIGARAAFTKPYSHQEVLKTLREYLPKETQ